MPTASGWVALPVTALIVNGRAVYVELPDDTPLLWALRDELGLTGTKFGCGIGVCGACTVHQDGQAVRSCRVTLAAAADSHVTTIEGLDPQGRHPVQLAWLAEQVPQCGYCQTGQIMQTASLLARTPRPTDEQIHRALAGNLCRCMTYSRIMRAVRHAAGMIS